MIDLKNITIIAVACVREEKTLKAMQFSMKGINFGAAKLLTSNLYIKDDNIEVINIEHLDYIGYNKFIVYELHKYIDTEYALLIQDDGFVINPEMWRDDFLNYDYIGAPWAIPNDNISYRDEQGTLYRCGNGGFSLRSKKMLKAPQNLNLIWESYKNYYNEDGYLCVFKRKILEDAGLIYAPLDVAKYFSHECELPETIGIKPFGFHGKWSKNNVMIT